MVTQKKHKFLEVDHCELLLIIYYIWLCCFTTIKRERGRQNKLCNHVSND